MAAESPSAHMIAYYNEFDPHAAQWLRNLIEVGLIAPGFVDQRSITEVEPDDLKGFTQCHFFAGIGGWSAALRLSAWPDDVPVWTGSCPCQPFSVAGKQQGARDERHLWPVFYDLIRACRPGIIFGEQVSSAAVVGTVTGHRPASAGDAPVWFDGVSADLEAEGYAVGAAVLGAHSVGAPHIRQRLFWGAVRLSDATGARCEGDSGGRLREQFTAPHGGLGDADGQRFSRGTQRNVIEETGIESSSRADAVRSDAWSDFRIVRCRDGKARRVGPTTSVLAHGVQRGLVDVRSGKETHTYRRTVALKGLGNAIVPQVAAQFIRAFTD